MAGTDIEAEQTPQSSPKLQGNVLLSGQLTAENTLRDVLEIVISQATGVQYGLLRILSKDVRGYMGIREGVTVVGAHVTSTCEYGLPALRKLIVAGKGMFLFMALEDLPIELRQELDVALPEVLNWRAKSAPDKLPLLREGLAAVTKGRTDVLSSLSECGEALEKGLLLLENDDSEEAFASYMAWGGEAPVLTNNLAKLTGALKMQNTGVKPEIERIPMPPDPIEELKQPGPSAQAFSALETLPTTVPSLPPPPGPKPTGNNQKGSMPGPAPEIKSQTGVSSWSVQDLESIPTPKGDGAARPAATAGGGNAGVGTAHGAQKKSEQNARVTGTTSQQMPTAGAAGEQRGKQSKSLDDLDRAFEAKAKIGASSNKGRTPTLQDQELSQLVSQRMQTVDPRTFINEPQKVMTPAERRRIEMMAILGGIVGLGLFLALGQQVFNITMGTQRYAAGLKALKSGNNVLAQVEFSTAYKLDGSPKALFYKALTEQRLGNLDAALKSYNALIGSQSKNLYGYAGRASLYIKQGNFDDAILDCDTMLSIKPDFIDAYRLRAIANSASGKYKEAILDATRYVDSLAVLGKLNVSTDVTQVNSTGSNNRALQEVYAARAFSYFQVKKFDEAIEDYTKAIELDTKNPHMYASRALAYKCEKAYKKALEDIETALQLDPSDSTLYKLRGQCYSGTGDAAKAAADLDRAVKMKPSVETYRLRGMARLDAKDFEGALEDFEYILSATPNDKSAKAKYDYARAQLNRTVKPAAAASAATLAEQEATTQKSAPAVSGSAKELIQKGYAALRSGHTGNAITLLASAVKADPNDKLARRYLAYAFQQKGDHANAVSQFGSLATLENLSSEDRLSYAKSLEAAKKLEPAAELYSQVLEAEPSNSAARVGLIHLYLKIGFPQRAAQLAQDGMSLSASSPQLVSTYSGLLKQAQAHQK